MEKQKILENLNLLAKQLKSEKECDSPIGGYTLPRMEKILENYLKNNPSDIDMWIKLMLVEGTPPFEDFDSIVVCAQRIFVYDPYNIPALLILMYAYYILGPHAIDDYPIQKLFHVKTNDDELAAMIEIAKAWWHEEHKNLDQYEKSLLASINLCQAFVYNYTSLGQFYIQNNRVSEGKELLKFGLKNVRKVYDNKTSYDWDRILDIEFFYIKIYKFTYISDSYYQKLMDILSNNE